MTILNKQMESWVTLPPVVKGNRPSRYPGTGEVVKLPAAAAVLTDDDASYSPRSPHLPHGKISQRREVGSVVVGNGVLKIV